MRDNQADREWERIDRDLALAEQASRLSIIRELQDVAIQSVTRMIAQADSARYAGERDPQAAVRAAAALRESGANALAEMRRVLSVVHEGERVAAPQPSLLSIDELLRTMEEAGLHVEFVDNGERFPLKRGAELTVFRILQIALGNTLKHGGIGTRARVDLTWTAEGLQLTVEDDGIRSAARRTGLNDGEIDQQTRYTIDDDLHALTDAPDGASLTTMRERAQIYGGVLSTRAVPGIGFSVTAVFPHLRYHNGVHDVNVTR